MNLEDLVDSVGLQQDKWSLTRPTFGKDNHLTVIGWSGRSRSGVKFYVIECSVCKCDKDIFSNGIFKSAKGNLLAGGLPCGCAISPRWTPSQYTTLCTRKALKLGIVFKSFVGVWKGINTRISLVCPKHGEWSTGDINGLLNHSCSCPACGAYSSGSAHTKTDTIMTTSFFASCAFHPDTKFQRSDRLTPAGYPTYWHVSCPECGETGESVSSNLQQGHRPCACSNQRQREGYINLIFDGNICVAIKFGIARDSKQRVKSQNTKSVYEIRQHLIYVFPDTSSCKAAERACKSELQCGVVSKYNMRDGFSETTHTSNIHKIIEIYASHGGFSRTE